MTTRRRRAVLIAALTLALALVLAPTALAAAGGGTSGFGGGGFGGGGGVGHSGGSGKAFFLYLIFRAILDLILLTHGVARVIVIAAIAALIIYAIYGRRIRAWWANRPRQGRAARRETKKRARRVELAAAVASDDDDAFDPDAVKAEAARLFNQVQAAWDAGNRSKLAVLVAPSLLAEWERRLDDFARRGWRNRVTPIGEPKIEYVGLTHGNDDRGDRVTVRIEAKLRDYVEDHQGHHIKRSGRLTETMRIREYWTLVRRGSRWMLASIEQGAEGEHALQDTVAPTPWSDEQALRDEALVEGAVADALPEGTTPAEVADLDYQGDARAAALDLSLADGRFAPDVLDVAARRAVAAWAHAVDGDQRPLLALAGTDAAYALLHPGGNATRLVIRGPEVKKIRIVALDAAATPPTMSIEVDVAGRRYLEDRATGAVVAGSQSRPTTFTEHWTLALDGPDDAPWQIARVGAPAPKPAAA